MPIIFAENFQQDTAESIVKRYPGSNNPLLAETVPNAFPIGAGMHYLNFGIIPFGTENTRFEVRMTFLPDSAGAYNSSITLNVFGLLFNSLVNNGGIQFGSMVLPSLRGKVSWNIIIERLGTGYQAIILMDDVVVMPPTSIGTWTPNSWVGINGGNPTLVYTSIPTNLSSIIVAVDTPVGTRLGATTWHKRELAVTNPGAWTYTDQGYIEDTDKTDPTIASPSIESSTHSAIDFEIVDGIEADITNLYINKSTELAETALSVDGRVYANQDAITFTSKQQVGNTFSIASVQQNGTTNGDIIFRGVTSLVSYAELSTLAGFTAGTLNTSSTGWLSFIIDGLPMFVSLAPARYNLSWDQINAANLVYGDKTIVINGTTYSIRLLKGADTDPFLGANGDDPIGSHNSEWTRIFAPISTVNFPSYTGPKLAAYSDAQLGFGGTLNGRSSWCQEAYSTARLTRGSTGASDLGWSAPTNAINAYGWRPCLVPLN